MKTGNLDYEARRARITQLQREADRAAIWPLVLLVVGSVLTVLLLAYWLGTEQGQAWAAWVDAR